MNQLSVLLVDEPTSALDHERGVGIIELTLRLADDGARCWNVDGRASISSCRVVNRCCSSTTDHCWTSPGW